MHKKIKNKAREKEQANRLAYSWTAWAEPTAVQHWHAAWRVAIPPEILACIARTN